MKTSHEALRLAPCSSIRGAGHTSTNVLWTKRSNHVPKTHHKTTKHRPPNHPERYPECVAYLRKCSVS